MSMCTLARTPEQRQGRKQVSREDGRRAGVILRTVGSPGSVQRPELRRGGMYWAQPEGVATAESEEAPPPLGLC